MPEIESLTDFDDDVAVVDADGRRMASGSDRLHIRLRAGREVDLQSEMDELSGADPLTVSGGAAEQNLVDELGMAFGYAYEDDEELWCGTRQSERDRHRWELDPASAEDFRERRR